MISRLQEILKTQRLKLSRERFEFQVRIENVLDEKKRVLVYKKVTVRMKVIF